MAVEAAREALRHADAAPHDIDLVLHASSYFQGYDLWAPASYVQREAVGNACLSLAVEQLSNGGMAALELAVAYLRADASRHSALVTTGDRFCLPGIDRWTTDPGTVLGDGGTAIVLSTAGGFALIRSLVTVSDPVLEKMGRGDDPFATAPMETRTPISVEEPRARLGKEMGMSELIDRLHTGQPGGFRTGPAGGGCEAGGPRLDGAPPPRPREDGLPVLLGAGPRPGADHVALGLGGSAISARATCSPGSPI
ncbi:hypothetical protein LT493_12060 [Streptomyces tricolor]|nr:hypothetical protein [Streptomyces tricolor]